MGSVFKEYAYPINNYNYNYKSYVDNNYSLGRMGINNAPTLDQFKTNIRGLNNFTSPLILDPIPTESSVAGMDDVDYSSREAILSAQKGFQQTPPYNRFRFEYPERDYPTTGIYSSSYFVQSGFCPVQSATSKAECLRKDPKYIWSSMPVQIPTSSEGILKSAEKKEMGNCFKPRYSYINNANDNGLVDGLIPGIVNDIMDTNPGNFLKLLDGSAIPGSTDTSPPRFQLLPCVAEHFSSGIGCSSCSSSPLWIVLLIIIIIALYYIFKKYA
jgi:hypothetical protein